MRALHATPAADDAVGRPLLPLLDRVRHLAARLRLFRSAALVVARRHAAPCALARRLDGIRHAPRRVHLDHACAAGVRERAATARIRRISGPLRRPGAAVRRDVLRPRLDGPPDALARGGAAADRAGGDGVRLSLALPELHRHRLDACAAARPDRRARRNADSLRAAGRGERSPVRRAGGVALRQAGAGGRHDGLSHLPPGKRHLRLRAAGARRARRADRAQGPHRPGPAQRGGARAARESARLRADSPGRDRRAARARSGAGHLAGGRLQHTPAAARRHGRAHDHRRGPGRGDHRRHSRGRSQGLEQRPGGR